MKSHSLKTQTGVGLIEVLITAIVIAVGLLAVASLQTSFLANSAVAKTRSEALALAEQKLEELRNNITVTVYNGQASSPSPEAIDGTNAAFKRSWVIQAINKDDGLPDKTANANAPNLKKISVCVSWDSPGTDCLSVPSDKKVNVVTEMAFLDPAKSALYAGQVASGGTMAVPSPRQNASEDVASENVDATTPTPLPGKAEASFNGDGTMPSSFQIKGEDGGTYTLKQITDAKPATHYYAAKFGNGIIAIYLCTPNGSGALTCEYIQNHFGGVPLRIAGTVYSTNFPNSKFDNALDNVRVAWSSSEVHYCYNGPKLKYSSDDMAYHYMAYECVFAGNCNATGDGVNGCFADSDVSDAQINDKKVGPGGEYGELGLIGVKDSQSSREQVCFLEDTTDPLTSVLLAASGSEVVNENYLFAVTKRSYMTRRIKRKGSGNEQKTEGINRSYTNHNFLIVNRGSGSSANSQCWSKAVANKLVLAPRQIVRVLNESGQPNKVMTEMSYHGKSGTAKLVLGAITGSSTDLALYMPETGSCYLNNNLTLFNSPVSYACVTSNNDWLPWTGLSIVGGSQSYPGTSPAVYASCNKPYLSLVDLSLCVWPLGYN